MHKRGKELSKQEQLCKDPEAGTSSALPPDSKEVSVAGAEEGGTHPGWVGLLVCAVCLVSVLRVDSKLL